MKYKYKIGDILHISQLSKDDFIIDKIFWDYNEQTYRAKLIKIINNKNYASPTFNYLNEYGKVLNKQNHPNTDIFK